MTEGTSEMRVYVYTHFIRIHVADLLVCMCIHMYTFLKKIILNLYSAHAIYFICGKLRDLHYPAYLLVTLPMPEKKRRIGWSIN